ncbi:MAG: hypothetical protein QOD72_372 [Acidimicrobiaceae bacterium]|nr:hypothetical protein [Acidimicrobiaceae bacterium]
MIVDELIVLQPDGLLRVGFHAKLTVVGGLDAEERDRFLETLHRATLGAEAGSELRYTDDSGKCYIVRRSSGRRRISIEDMAAARALGDLTLPGPEDLPRITQITSADLAGPAGELPSVPMLVERLIGWLGRARSAGTRGRPSLAVLSEPLGGLDSGQTWDLLNALERLGQIVQIVYLTEDTTVIAWARERELTESLTLIDQLVLTSETRPRHV